MNLYTLFKTFKKRWNLHNYGKKYQTIVEGMITFLLEPEMNKSKAATAFLLSKAAKSPFSAAGARSTILAPYEVLARYLVDALTAPSALTGAKGAKQTPTEATAPTILLIFIWKATATAKTANTMQNRNIVVELLRKMKQGQNKKCQKKIRKSIEVKI